MSVSSRRFLISLSAFLVPFSLTVAWLQAQRWSGAPGKLRHLVSESQRREPKCEAYQADLRYAAAGEVLDRSSALKLISILERHPGVDSAAQAAQSLVVQVPTLASRTPESLTESFSKIEPFCALPDYFGAWHKLVENADRLHLKNPDKERLARLGLNFLESESKFPTRAQSTLLEVAALNTLSRSGLFKVPAADLKRIQSLATRLKTDVGTSIEGPSSLDRLRIEIESANPLHREVSSILDRSGAKAGT